MIDADFLALLCCPLTHQPLRLAPPEISARFTPPAEAALVREDGLVAYPIRDGIPVLVSEEALPLDPSAN